MPYLASKIRSYFHPEEALTGDVLATRAAHLTAGRVWCVLVSIIIPIFGVLYRLFDPVAIDLLWSRFAITAVPMGLVVASYVSALVRRYFIELVYGVVYVIFTWFLVLTVLNAFSVNYAVGMIMVFSALGVAPSVGVGRSELLTGFFAYGLILTALAIFAVPEPEVNPFIFMGCMGSMALILYIALETRTLVEESLAESEQRYRAVLHQTSDGVFLVDLETGRFVEANPAYCALVGYTVEELRQHSLGEIDDENLSFRADGATGASAEAQLARCERRHRHRSGTLIDVETSANRIRYEGGEMLSVVVRDIRERKRAEQTLHRAKEHAEEMQQHAEEMLRAKSALVNNVSHELRTPLTGIMGFADILKEEVAGEHQEFAELISESAERLMQTLNSVMDLAKLESGAVRLRPQRLCLAEEARAAARLLEGAARRRGLHLRVEEQAEGVEAQLDAACLHRVLHNLVGNAVKFTEEGGVTVEIDQQIHFPSSSGQQGDGQPGGAGWAVVRVRDTGIGIGEAFLPRLFEEFKQESEGLSRSHEGVGLGLAITKQLVDLMGGHISVESKRGGGTTFTIMLPCSPREPAEEASSDGDAAALPESAASAPARPAAP